MRKKYLHILSFDGLSKVDFEKIKNLPAFSEFLKGASGCINVRSVYPSLTYCAHTSITTGVYPGKHKIINNTRLDVNRKSPDWFWYEKDIKADTFQALAKKSGYDILSIFWPVTAGSKNIKYNMPEIFANRWWKNQIFVSLFNGSPYFQMKLNSLFGKMRNGFKEPELDNFSHSSFLYSLENFKADINMVHYIDLDSQRHEYGFDSIEAEEALKRLDKRLFEVIEKLKQIGIYDDSVIVVLGDHSSIDGHSNIYINSILQDAGLLTSENKLVKDYQVVCKSADGSAYIYFSKDIREIEKVEELKHRVVQLLNPLVEKNIIQKIYDKKDVIDFGADEGCELMLEASKGYFFMNQVEDRVVIPVEETYPKGDEKLEKSDKICINNHGYNPCEKQDYETVFFISGRGIKKGEFIDEMSLVDEGPTLAKIMNFKMENIDGREIIEFLEDEGEESIK